MCICNSCVLSCRCLSCVYAIAVFCLAGVFCHVYMQQLCSVLQVFGAVPRDQTIGFPQGSGGQSASVGYFFMHLFSPFYNVCVCMCTHASMSLYVFVCVCVLELVCMCVSLSLLCVCVCVCVSLSLSLSPLVQPDTGMSWMQIYSKSNTK